MIYVSSCTHSFHWIMLSCDSCPTVKVGSCLWSLNVLGTFLSEGSSDHVFKCSHKFSFNSVMYIHGKKCVNFEVVFSCLNG